MGRHFRDKWRVGPATRRLAVGSSTALLVLLAVCAQLTAANAQGFDQGGSFVTPFPEKDAYRTYVFGDSLGDGLAGALAEVMRDDKSVEVFKKTRAGSGFTRPEVYDWIAAARDTAAKERLHVAIVVMGISERQPIRIGTKRLLLGSGEWRTEYGRRVDEFLKALRRSNAAIYWIGLPIMKAAQATEDMQMINSIVREKVFLNGGKFIDTWNGFTDVDGQYSQTGPDLSGKMRVLRDNDGMHFTKDGYRKLVHFLERELRRDITIARAERNVPLAGGEAEQRRINAARQAAAEGDAAAPRTQVGAVGVTRPSAAPAVLARPQAAPERAPADADPQSLEQKADNARVTVTLPADAAGRAEVVQIEIVRPTIPAQVIAHVSRRAGPQKAAIVGENVTRDLAGGLTLMSSVTTFTELAGQARRAVPTTQTLQYKVLVKGDPQPSRPGRADDFRWPKVDAVPGG
jgi:hypothetical protein